jgi:hypothetical protein
MFLGLGCSSGLATIDIVPTYNGYSPTQEAVVDEAISQWEALLGYPTGVSASETIEVTFDLGDLGAIPPGDLGLTTVNAVDDLRPWNNPIPTRIQLNTNGSELWYDPTPATDDGDQPAGSYDALTVALHEIGHALGIHVAWNDSGTSVWESHVTGDPPVFDAGGLDIELVAGDTEHFADTSDLMAVDIPPDQRRSITIQDVSVLQLAYGYTSPIPEPSSALLLIGACAGFVLRRRR